MGRQRHGAEQIIAKLREAEVELARGKTAGEVCRKLGITEQTRSRGLGRRARRPPPSPPAPGRTPPLGSRGTDRARPAGRRARAGPNRSRS